jgi:repressor LexA
MIGLTDRQRQVLNVIIDSVEDRGYPPTIKEIHDAIGIGSTSSVFFHLRALQHKGYIRIDGGPRAIAVIKPGDA